jgi:hypothetical protein
MLVLCSDRPNGSEGRNLALFRGGLEVGRQQREHHLVPFTRVRTGFRAYGASYNLPWP